MNVNANRLTYKRIKNIKFISSLLKGDLYEVEFNSYPSEQHYDTEIIDYINKYGTSLRGTLKQIKEGDMLIDLK